MHVHVFFDDDVWGKKKNYNKKIRKFVLNRTHITTYGNKKGILARPSKPRLVDYSSSVPSNINSAKQPVEGS